MNNSGWQIGVGGLPNGDGMPAAAGNPTCKRDNRKALKILLAIPTVAAVLIGVLFTVAFSIAPGGFFSDDFLNAIAMVAIMSLIFAPLPALVISFMGTKVARRMRAGRLVTWGIVDTVISVVGILGAIYVVVDFL